MAKITFNGQEYDSPEAMPPEVRQVYQMMTGMLSDANQDGVPDLFAGIAGAAAPTVVQTTQFVVDGKAYSSLDELPPEARQKYAQAMSRLDANHNGIPDLFEGGALNVSASSPASEPTPTPTALPSLVQVIGEPQPANRAMILLLAGVIVLLLAGVAWYLLSR
jgi:hypothetical protein